MKTAARIRDKLRADNGGATTYRHDGVTYKNEEEFLAVTLAMAKRGRRKTAPAPVAKPDWKGANLVTGAIVSESYKAGRRNKISVLSGRGPWEQSSEQCFDPATAEESKKKRNAIKAKGRKTLRNIAAAVAVEDFEKSVVCAIQQASKKLLEQLVFLGESDISEVGKSLAYKDPSPYRLTSSIAFGR